MLKNSLSPFATKYIASHASKQVERSGFEQKADGYLLEQFIPFSSNYMNRSFILNNINCDPFSKTAFGVVMFADISGFTRLSSILSVEDLKFHINSLFTTIVSIIDKYCGDIIKFCGDALLIFWPLDLNVDERYQRAAVEIATLCALHLLLEVGKYESGTGDSAVSLGIHCGIGCGDTHCMTVGNKERWEFLISGHAVIDAGNAASHAGIGTVCLSYCAFDLVEDIFDGVHQSDCIKVTGLLTTGTTSQVLDSSWSKRSTSMDSDVDDNLSLTSARSTKESLVAIGASIKSLVSSPKKLNATYLANDIESIRRQRKFESNSFVNEIFFQLSKNAIGTGSNDGYCEKVLSYFVPETARRAIQTNTQGMLAELRQLATIFIKFDGLEIDFLEGNFNRPQQLIEISLRELKKYGGVLRQFVFDDKGCVMIIIFGLPGYSHEDNCSRSIETAMNIKNSVKCLNIVCCIGIALGQAYCGLVGCSTRCEYAVMGSSVNLAARLMSHAQSGYIYVSEEVYKRTIDDFEFVPVSKIKCKGFAKAIQAYSPTHRSINPKTFFLQDLESTASNFIGRQNEVEKFNKAVASFVGIHSNPTAWDRKQWHIIKGVAGVGKSQLLFQISKMLKQYSKLSATHVINIATSDASKDYSVICQLLDSLFKINSNRGRFYSIQDMNEKGDSPRALISSKYSSTFLREYECHVADWFSENSESFRPKEFFECGAVEITTSGSKATIETEDYSDLQHDLTHSFSADHLKTGSEKIAAELAEPKLDDLFPLLNDILPVAFPENRHTSDLRKEERVTLVQDLLVKILEIALITENVIIIENLQWCDLPSGKILLNTLKFADRGLFIGTIRKIVHGRRSFRFNQSSCISNEILYSDVDDPGENQNETSNINEILDKLCRHCNCTSLTPFTNAEVKEMIEITLGERLLAQNPDIVKQTSLYEIMERTQGSPYLTCALSLTLRDSLLSGQFNGIGSLPSGENDIIINRFDQVTRTDQLILKIASVIGRSFDADFLISVLSYLNILQSNYDVPAALNELTKTNLIQNIKSLGSASSVTGVYAFADNLVRQCIYNLMLSAQKDKTHGGIAMLLETSSDETQNSQFQVIASHYMLSDNLIKKVEYLERAAVFATDEQNYRYKISYLEKLIAISTGMEPLQLLLFCTKDVGCSASQKAEFTAVGGMINAPGFHARKISTADSITSQWYKPNDISTDFPIDDKFMECINCNKELADSIGINCSNIQQKVFFWLGSLASSFFRLGNVKLAHNLCILFLKGVGVDLPRFEDRISGLDRIRMFIPTFSKERKLCWKESLAFAIFEIQLTLAKIFLFRGQLSYSANILEQIHKTLPFLSNYEAYCTNFYSLENMVVRLQGDDGRKSRLLTHNSLQKINDDEFTNSFCFWTASVLACTKGKFRDARGYITLATKSFRLIHKHFMKLSCVTFHGWICIFSGKIDRAKSLQKRVETYAPYLQQSPAAKWSVELKIILTFLEGNVSATLDMISELSHIRKRDSMGATTSAIFAFVSVQNGGLSHEVLAAIKYSISRLTDKDDATPITSFFLFCAGYAALSFVADIGSSQKSEVFDLRSSQVRDDIKRSADEVIKIICRHSKRFPFVKMLYYTLVVMKYRLFNPAKLVANMKEYCSYLCDYEEFIFGRAYYTQQLYEYFKDNKRLSPPLKASQVATLDSETLYKLSRNLFSQLTVRSNLAIDALNDSDEEGEHRNFYDNSNSRSVYHFFDHSPQDGNNNLLSVFGEPNKHEENVSQVL